MPYDGDRTLAALQVSLQNASDLINQATGLWRAPDRLELVHAPQTVDEQRDDALELERHGMHLTKSTLASVLRDARRQLHVDVLEAQLDGPHVHVSAPGGLIDRAGRDELEQWIFTCELAHEINGAHVRVDARGVRMRA